MKKQWTFLLAAALLAGSCLSASAAPCTLSVTGTGTASAEANQAEFTATVETSADTQQSAAAENAVHTRVLRAALLRTGAHPDELTTQNYTVNPIYTYDGSTRKTEGYRAANQIRVRIPRTELTGFLIDAAAENGATAIDSLRFTNTDTETARSQAIAAAAADARSQAEALAAAMGATLGPVLSAGGNTSAPVYYSRTELLMSKAAAGNVQAVTPVDGGQQEVRVQLYVTYELI